METARTRSVSFSVRLEPAVRENIEKICRATNENKTDLMHRLINNELALIEGRAQDFTDRHEKLVQGYIKHIAGDIRRQDYKLDHLTELTEKLYKADKLYKLIDETGKRTMAAIGYTIRLVYRTLYYLSRILYLKLNVTRDEIDRLGPKADEMAAKQCKAAFDTIMENDYETFQSTYLFK